MTDIRLFGIRMRIHLLFWVVIVAAVTVGYVPETLTLFAIVLIHELGHVAAAREVGWTVTEIQLLPFGGMAKVENEMTAHPLDEMVVALAGPFMNVAMIFLSMVCWWMGIWPDDWTRFFVESNLLIAGFNLLPIWPLDGGRILQAALSLFLSYRRAVLWSLGWSIVWAAVLLGVAVMLGRLHLSVVAGYLVFENGKAFLRFPYQFFRFLLHKYEHGDREGAVVAVPISGDWTVKDAVHRLRKGRFHFFLIRHPARKGESILHEKDVLEAYFRSGPPILPIHDLLNPSGRLKIQ